MVLYNRLAEVAREYAKKGGMLYIEGRIETKKWTDKDGQDRYTTEISGEEMQLMGGRDTNDDKSSNRGSTPSTANHQQTSGCGVADMDDDIPF